MLIIIFEKNMKEEGSLTACVKIATMLDTSLFIVLKFSLYIFVR